MEIHHRKLGFNNREGLLKMLNCANTFKFVEEHDFSSNHSTASSAIKTEIRRNVKSESHFRVIGESLDLIRALVLSVTDGQPSTVINKVYYNFVDQSKVDIIIDVNDNYKSVFFGKRFVNKTLLIKMMMNLSAKITKVTKNPTLIHVHSIE